MIDTLNKIFTVIYSIYFNFKYLPFSTAKYLPIKINYKTRVKIDKTSRIVVKDYTRFSVKLGLQGTPFVSDNSSSTLTLNKGATMLFYGGCVIGQGQNIYVDNNAKIVIGNNVYINKNVLIQCTNLISISDDCLIGWNVRLRDTDGHRLIRNDIEIERKKSNIYLRKNVWLAADVIVLKGSVISEGSIVVTGSIVVGLKLEKGNCLIAGIPGRVKRTGITLEN